MVCPKCGGDTTVKGNRWEKKENETFRVRVCKRCGDKFHTVEFEVEENEKFKKIWSSLWREYHRERREQKAKE